MSDNLAAAPPTTWLNRVTRDRVAEIVRFLTERGTFRFPALKSGLFSAAAFEHHDPETTGYSNVWTRDAVHITHALWVLGETEAATRSIGALGEFYTHTQNRFHAVIADPLLALDPMHRPHIRFRGETLTELDEKWSHAQNDALGYWLWLTSRMVIAGDLNLTVELAETLSLLVRYFNVIEYWADADSGHWEEVRKVAASSIGVALAGLKAFQNVVEMEAAFFPDRDQLLILIESLIKLGQLSLDRILPHETIDGDATQVRDVDAALLFLIYPLGTVRGSTADQVLQNVHQRLEGPIGVRRYNGDSYWCANYRTLLSAETRTSDFSDDLSARDRLLQPGTEAQWCIFDSILSIIYAQRYLELRDPADHERQLHHLRRALGQLTTADSRFGPYRCPESYFLEGDAWIPNDITPLLWTQANLRLGLYWLDQTLQT